MKNKTNFLTYCVALLAFTTFGFIAAENISAQNTQPAASGSGSLLVQNEQGDFVRRQFSFSVNTRRDGTVQGNAILHNAAFTGADGRTYKANFELSCLKVVGNYAFIGGTVRRTNDPNLTDSAFFVVQDNGEPGKNNDLISSVYFSSDYGPEACQDLGPSDFPLIPIETGNINVRGGTNQ